MRTLELNEIAHVSGGLLGAESGSFLCDASDTRPPGTNAWGEVPTEWDHFMSAFGAWKANFAAGATDFSLSAIQTVIDHGPISWLLGTNSGVGADGLRTDGAPLGYGCGTAGTDRIVPDTIFGVSNAVNCKTHDDEFTACVDKNRADLNFKTNTYDTLVKAGIDSVRATIVSEIYFQAVQSSAGQSAYDASCPKPKA
jgi:hypothetical protein